MFSGIHNNSTGYHHRQSIRLPGFNYAKPGYYFITICIHDRKQQLFGNVLTGTMVDNECGRIVRQCWAEIPQHFPNVRLDEFVLMPNHVHGIIKLADFTKLPTRRGTACRCGCPIHRRGTACQCECSPHRRGTACRAPTRNDGQILPVNIEHFGQPTVGTIPTIVRSFKSAISKQIHRIMPEFKWQRNYYEHVIRDDRSLFFIRKYIQENPIRWNSDFENHIDEEIKMFDHR